jgi:nucleoside-diphosphate-sugar epimerase
LEEVTKSQNYGVTESQSHRVTESQYLLRDFETNPKGVTSRLRDSVTFPVSASPLNLGSGEKTSLNDLIKIISRKLGTTVTPKYDPPRSGDILHSYCEISQINDILTFKPQVTMEIGIEKMLKYYNLAD